VWRRAQVLNRLEEAEARYIESFRSRAGLRSLPKPSRSGVSELSL
jgi:hypothetical protein